ncbi:MAG: DUF1122 family protein [Sulfolobales archaeon]|nr:DUF1122 family protein [Sulfolobales archaeon]
MSVSFEGCKRENVKELEVCELRLNGRPVGRAFYFHGRPPFYPKWIELIYDPWPRKEGLEVELFRALAEELGPGGRLFVVYLKDEKTTGLLYRGFHPVDTPLGMSLLRAGFTWFKDWYFPEGGAEGGMKLQANLPVSDDERVRQLCQLFSEVRTEEAKRAVEEELRKRGLTESVCPQGREQS